MNRFAELMDRLAYEPARNNKLRLLTDYFRFTPDPERGWALAALTGALSFPHAKAGLIRSLIAERTDPVLFELSYDYVGDLSETVALMWAAPLAQRAPSPLVGEGWGGGSGGEVAIVDTCESLLDPHPYPSPQGGGDLVPLRPAGKRPVDETAVAAAKRRDLAHFIFAQLEIEDRGVFR